MSAATVAAIELLLRVLASLLTIRGVRDALEEMLTPGTPTNTRVWRELLSTQPLPTELAAREIRRNP
jgi:hypothetical protein